MAKSLNKVTLIGNLTRDPEMRFTPSGAGVCSFGIATNRQWTVEGEKKEDVEFHKIVAWNKLAEICAQLLTKGRKVYVEGRLQTRSWQAQDGAQKSTTEIVIDDMILLDPKGSAGAAPVTDFDIPENFGEEAPVDEKPAKTEKTKAEKPAKVDEVKEPEGEDIPF